MTTTVTREVAGFCNAAVWVTPVPALVIDQHSVVFANAAALRLLDYADASQIVGQPLDRILHPDALVAEMARRKVLDAIGEPLFGVPTKLRSGTGESLQELADVFPIRTSDARLTLFTFKAEQCPDNGCALPAMPDFGSLSPTLGAAILEVVPTCMLIHDLDTILFANAITRGYFGAVDRSELEGRSILSIIHPDGMLSTMERVAFVFATHQRIREVPIKLKRLDGGIVHAVSDAYPIRAEGRWGALIVGEVVREEDTASRR